MRSGHLVPSSGSATSLPRDCGQTDGFVPFFFFLQSEEESQLNHFTQRIREMIKGCSMCKSTLTNYALSTLNSFIMRACFNWFLLLFRYGGPIDQQTTAVKKIVDHTHRFPGEGVLDKPWRGHRGNHGGRSRGRGKDGNCGQAPFVCFPWE